MIDYKVSPKAEGYFKKLKDRELKKKYHEAIKAIRINPSIGESKKGDLKGILGYDVYHNGVNYEIALHPPRVHFFYGEGENINDFY